MARCAWPECGTWRPDVLAGPGGLGVIFERTWYCSRRCVERAAAARLAAARLRDTTRGPRPIPPLKLGMLLVHHGAVTPVQLAEALDAQRRSGLRLGRQLQALSFVSRSDLLRALATQSGAPWLQQLDPTRVRSVPSALSHAAVRALGLVPFEVDAARSRVKVACVGPVPRLALGALAELTGWVAEPFLVADDVMPSLLAAYEEGVQDRAGSGEALALSPRDAASRIAQVAAAARETRLSHARCDPYLWVRVETDARVDDMLVRPTEAAQERTCQAAPTLH